VFHLRAVLGRGLSVRGFSCFLLRKLREDFPENGEYGLVRWTAPADGFLSIATTFTGIDLGTGTTTDVHVLQNGSPLFDGLVNGYLDAASFIRKLTVAHKGT
jgi:hypothetical protein